MSIKPDLDDVDIGARQPGFPAASAEEAAFTDLFRSHREGIARYMVRRGADELAADLAAETFAIAWRRRAQWRALDAEQQVAWLYGVARNVLANAHRAQRRAAGLADRLVQAADRNADVADHGNLTVEQLAVAAAFDQLSDADQEVIRLVAWDALTPQQAAQVLGCRTATLAMRLHRARTRLKKLIDSPTNSSTRENGSHP